MVKILNSKRLADASEGLIWAFDWESTPEGRVYWGDIQRKLARMLFETRHTHAFKCECGERVELPQ